jgi:hypothetical protein
MVAPHGAGPCSKNSRPKLDLTPSALTMRRKAMISSAQASRRKAMANSPT